MLPSRALVVLPSEHVSSHVIGIVMRNAIVRPAAKIALNTLTRDIRHGAKLPNLAGIWRAWLKRAYLKETRCYGSAVPRKQSKAIIAKIRPAMPDLILFSSHRQPCIIGKLSSALPHTLIHSHIHPYTILHGSTQDVPPLIAWPSNDPAHSCRHAPPHGS